MSPDRSGPLRRIRHAATTFLLVATGALFAADGWPGYGWDGLSIWLVRAKVLAWSAELPAAFFREPQLVQGHWDYPLLLPALLAWFARFAGRLLEGSEPVLRLLASNPFPDAPPRVIRSRVHRYRFAPATTRAHTGRWWIREEPGAPFCPPLRAER